MLLLVVGNGLCAGAEIDFGRDIRPILSDKCFQCHGADEGTLQGDLRLDVRESAVALRDGVAAIVPRRPDESLLVQRILSHDPAEQMPPPDSNKSLTPRQIELLQAWVAQGAEYSEHWAFRPVPVVQIPATNGDGWAKNEIDAFVLQRLKVAGLSPSPEADRATLIRRLYQDLLGLLPSPEESKVFVEDPAPDAYERLVDRLLQSPHYGERWGRHWLDQARYADSHGFTIDGPRIMWPFRDWVIQAVNADMPFDQFTIEQLAGDLLEKPTKSQLVATGFHRNTMINQEGGVKPDQYRHEAVIDRVNTTGAVWLGLTIGCAQCHTHKFDPVSHDDYYRLYAFFNRCADENNTGPTVDVYQQEMFGLTETQLADIDKLKQLRNQLQALNESSKQQQGRQLLQANWKWQQAEFKDFSTESNGTFQKLPDGSLLSDQNGNENDTYQVSLNVPRGKVSALRLRVLPHPSLPSQGPGLAKNGNFVLTEVELRVGGKKIPLENAGADHEQDNYFARSVIDQNAKSGWAINVSNAQKKADPQLAMNAPHELVVTLKKPVVIDADTDVTVFLKHGLNRNYLIGRFLFDYSNATPDIAKPVVPRGESDLQQQIQNLEAMVPGRGIAQDQMIMSDMDQPTETYRLRRGDFLQPAKEEGVLSPGVPKVLTDHLAVVPEFRNRLDLARWLVSRENPLTARVTVNRVWMKYFGLGLVETENDFGYQSSPPTHPELLDWLAGEFMQRGWSMKQLHRLIVTSATYRQSSRHHADLEEVDPRNLLLGRQSRVRVEAEIVRDMALLASGRFAPRLGGPSVFPPQPDGVYRFTQNKKSWPESQGPDRYRRTMYTMLYRSAPFPLMTTFDSPDFSTVCTQRPRSNTPLQSLTLANDVIFVELAQGLAERVLKEVPADAGLNTKIDFLFQVCLTRSPTSDELTLLEQYWNQEFARYARDEKGAVEVAPKLADGLNPAAAAAWVSVSRVLLNTDEFITRN